MVYNNNQLFFVFNFYNNSNFFVYHDIDAMFVPLLNSEHIKWVLPSQPIFFSICVN